MLKNNLYLSLVVYISSLVAGELSYVFLMSKYLGLLHAMIIAMPFTAIISAFVLAFYAIIFIAVLKVDLDSMQDIYTRQGKTIILMFNFFIMLILWHSLWEFLINAFA